MSSATDTIRSMLNERGVEYDTRDSKNIKKTMESTYWDDSDGRRWGYTSDESGAIKDRQLFLVRGRMDFTPEQAINATLGPKITEDTSDGWHTFKELYHHRALLFSVIVSNYRDLCWKSKRHHDGKLLDWNFIVGIDTPWGQASYHYGMDYWDLFDCKVLERAPYYDGYSANESVARIAMMSELARPTPETCNNNEADIPSFFLCSECGYKNWDTYEGSDSFNFCPSCGRKVVSKEEPKNDIHAVVNVPDWQIQTINVTFQGMNLTLDADESEGFMRVIRDHVRRAEESGASDD